MATHSSVLAWRIPRMGEPGGLPSIGSHRVGHDWATSLSLFTFMHWRRKWQPTPVFLPGESQGWGSLVGCHPWGRTESDMTEMTQQQQQQQQQPWVSVPVHMNNWPSATCFKWMYRFFSLGASTLTPWSAQSTQPLNNGYHLCVIRLFELCLSYHFLKESTFNWENIWIHCQIFYVQRPLPKFSFLYRTMEFIISVYPVWRRHWWPTPILLSGNSYGQRSLVGCSPWVAKSWTWLERLHFHFSLSCIGEGNGNPLHCSCLENPRDAGSLVGCCLWSHTESDTTEAA